MNDPNPHRKPNLGSEATGNTKFVKTHCTDTVTNVNPTALLDAMTLWLDFGLA